MTLIPFGRVVGFVGPNHQTRWGRITGAVYIDDEPLVYVVRDLHVDTTQWAVPPRDIHTIMPETY